MSILLRFPDAFGVVAYKAKGVLRIVPFITGTLSDWRLRKASMSFFTQEEEHGLLRSNSSAKIHYH